jgi:8-oxo-dGTP diphosphatase
MRIRPSIVICKENKIMLLRYSYSGKDVYQFPGGNMEEVETLEQTLARELMEELYLPVNVGNLLLSAQVINIKKQQATLHCLFEGKIRGEATPTLNPDQTSALEITWMNIEQLEELNLYPSVGKKLRELLSGNTSLPKYLGLIDQPWF